MDISQLIKYEGPNDILVWKHPIEDFNTTIQLIVYEPQEAALFRNGQALYLFSSESIHWKPMREWVSRKLQCSNNAGVSE